KSTEIPGLQVLPCGPTPPNPAEICQSERFKDLVKDLAGKYDHIILDSPPVMAVTDAVILSALVDAVVMIVRTGSTAKDAFSETLQQLRSVGDTKITCLLNDVDGEKTGYGYRRYGYYRRGSYYGRSHGYYGEESEETS
ncbi:MAG: CpsD/CapB family tyrosine-protein kinase, partial [Deltaproteobacteria bacterium]|nr:CpsD/CapB family tyrosine-protein kinase [Deltaproteobacteria bacterium]